MTKTWWSVEPSRPWQRVLRAGVLAWAILGVVGVAIVAYKVLAYLALVVIPILLAFFVAAALSPVTQLLDRPRVPRPVAAFLAVVFAFALIGGVIALIVPSFTAQLPSLIDALGRAATRLDQQLSGLPLLGPGIDLRAMASRLAGYLFGGGSVTAALGVAVSVLTAIVLLIVIVFFYLAEGRWLVSGIIRWLPERRREEAWELAGQLWRIVGQYFRGLLIIALVDSVLIGLGLVLLGVPLAFPLAVLVYIGAFLPFIGAITSGLLAALIALAERGLGIALAVLGVVLAVQQLEGSVLQPLVMGRLIRLPAFVVLLSIAIGATVLGVLGAFLAVPVAACVARILDHVSETAA